MDKTSVKQFLTFTGLKYHCPSSTLVSLGISTARCI